MKSPVDPPLLPGLSAALSARRARVEEVLARPGGVAGPDAVHDLRVALRRTAALAKMTRGVPHAGDGDSLRIAARDLRRLLSSRRSEDVCRARLLARFRRDPERRKAAVELAARLRGLAGRNGPSLDRAVTARLASLRRAFALRDAELSRLERFPAGRAAGRAEKRLLARILRRLEKRRRRLLKDGEPTAESLHPMRIAAKELRYGLELVKERFRGAVTLLPPLKRFQDLSGVAHDRAELVAAVRRLLPGVPRGRRREAVALLPPLERDADLALRKARAEARRLLARLAGARFPRR